MTFLKAYTWTFHKVQYDVSKGPHVGISEHAVTFLKAHMWTFLTMQSDISNGLHVDISKGAM